MDEQQGDRAVQAPSNGARRRRKSVIAATNPIRHLDQDEVAQRWSISPQNLGALALDRKGPRFLKIGGRVVYRVEDIEAYEAEQLRTSTLPVSGGGAR